MFNVICDSSHRDLMKVMPSTRSFEGIVSTWLLDNLCYGYGVMFMKLKEWNDTK